MLYYPIYAFCLFLLLPELVRFADRLLGMLLLQMRRIQWSCGMRQMIPQQQRLQSQFMLRKLETFGRANGF